MIIKKQPNIFDDVVILIIVFSTVDRLQELVERWKYFFRRCSQYPPDDQKWSERMLVPYLLRQFPKRIFPVVPTQLSG
ncbi:hypothetical protein AKJ37_04915 [candidate division MSBL1 archaeon SCGC-AAA259I09]|uniref:Uncharacterized protein n=1 Tax=candidate division MSBL1 archaeon SCGC-AAA259I09 TaxID=1698267 RepID=A0A133UQY8_9EURY|nr:hypothetical protein AKJ37_04915 [candidate division MSBL1 archaeon SCGC-AAA259I09]